MNQRDIRISFGCLILLGGLGFFIDILLDGLTLTYHSSPFLGFYAFFLLILFLGFSRNSFFNPFVFFLPLPIYYLPSLLVLQSSSPKSVHYIGWMLFLSLVSFGVGFYSQATKYSLSIIVKSRDERSRPTFRLLLLIFLILLTQTLLHFFSNAGQFGKGVNFLLKNILSLSLLGYLFVLAHRSRFAFNAAFAVYFSSVFLTAFMSEDASRFSLIKASMLYLCAIASTATKLKPISTKVILTGVLAIAAIATVVGSDGLTTIGGDALILKNAEEAINYIDETGWKNVEPGMPIFNAGLNLFPDSLWLIGKKPKEYNPSAWYIDNIMGLSPSDYQWGVGLAGIGAAYIYGKYLGVVILYLMMGIFIGFLAKRSTTPFLLGIYFSHITDLPFAMYRMDETFLFGSAAISVPFILIVVAHARLRRKIKNEIAIV